MARGFFACYVAANRMPPSHDRKGPGPVYLGCVARDDIWRELHLMIRTSEKALEHSYLLLRSRFLGSFSAFRSTESLQSMPSMYLSCSSPIHVE